MGLSIFEVSLRPFYIMKKILVSHISGNKKAVNGHSTSPGFHEEERRFLLELGPVQRHWLFCIKVYLYLRVDGCVRAEKGHHASYE